MILVLIITTHAFCQEFMGSVTRKPVPLPSTVRCLMDRDHCPPHSTCTPTSICSDGKSRCTGACISTPPPPRWTIPCAMSGHRHCPSPLTCTPTGMLALAQLRTLMVSRATTYLSGAVRSVHNAGNGWPVFCMFGPEFCYQVLATYRDVSPVRQDLYHNELFGDLYSISNTCTLKLVNDENGGTILWLVAS